MKKSEVRPKKHLGQHFLKDENIARKIVESLNSNQAKKNVLEIGPGTGVLTRFLIDNTSINYKAIELDRESVDYLIKNYHLKGESFVLGDFLKMDLHALFEGEPFSVIGNFPYNISSQILFKLVENSSLITEMVGMFQKEVAERVAEKEGSKVYGAISVMIQAVYDVEYLFTVNEQVFDPPPKVKSAVIRLSPSVKFGDDFDFEFFRKLVKAAFGQRRKTMRNSLKPFLAGHNIDPELLALRPERLSAHDFIKLTNDLR